VTPRRACLATLVAIALPALVLVPQAGAKKAAPQATAKAAAQVATKPASNAAAKASPAKAAHGRKRSRATRRMRWRTAASAFRIGPGALFGGSVSGGTATPAPGGGPGVPAPGGGSDPTAPAPVYHTLSVASKEFSLTLSRQLLTPGSETVQLNNRGEDPHNLVISPEDGSSGPLATYPDVASLDSHTQQVELPAGRYKLWCSLPGHEALGMHATLRVE
jgi:hypothetical protein